MKEKSNNTSKRKKYIKNSLNFIVFLIICTGIYWSFRSYFQVGNDNFTNSAQVEAFINPINTRVSAYIKDIRFVEHQSVKKGDTLIILDNREIKTQLGQAEANLLQALANKNVANNITKTSINQVQTANASANVAKANLDATKARLWNAKRNFQRYENLLKDEAVTKQQYDQIKTEYEAALAAVNAAEYQFIGASNGKNSSELTVNEVKSKVSINDADIIRTQNALEMAKLNMSYTIIKAPHDGIMGRRNINVGQLLNVSQQVATIVDTKSLWVSANFREKQMKAVKLNKLVTIKVDALDGKEYHGKITAISGATGAKYAAAPIDNSTGNFVKVQQRIPIRIEFINNKINDLELLRAGMNVEVTINN